METKDFKFENGVSIHVPLVENETSWFIASDICEILGLSDTRQSVERLDEDEKRKESVRTKGQTREVWLINEYGLYQLIITSEKEEAKSFKRWITHEVLPALRKSGKYTLEQANNRESLIQGKVKQIETIEDSIKNANSKLLELKKNLGLAQLELKGILKADIKQLELIFDTEQV